METDDAAATLRLIYDAMEEVRRRSRCDNGRSINDVIEEVCRSRKRERSPASLMLQANAGLAEADPWDLPPLFVMRKESSSSSLRTHSGYWKEEDDDFTAIRSQGAGSSSPSRSPSYCGVRRTLEFYRKNGTKTDWIIHEYQVLDPDRLKPDALLLQEDVVIRKVFRKKGTDHQLHFVIEHLCNQLDQLPDADGESEVWQHFTRIKTKDPGVVYAACHRCDKVLKAHSRNGTTHLKRHRRACSCNNNPANAADEKILRDLRATIDLYKQEKMEGKVVSPEHNTDLAKLDPWDPQFTPCYFTSSLCHDTLQGHWKEIDKERAAIRINEQLQEPRYVGLKRTFKFHHHKDTKMDYWIMLEYHQVDEYMPPSLLLEGSMVFRKVFPIYEDAVKEVDMKLNGDEEEEEFYNGVCEEEVKAFMGTLVHDCLLGEGVQGGQSRPGKRKRSKIWLHFTKIYTTDPDRVYAVCHCCDRGYEGRSKNGTSHLKRHNKTCSSKHLKL